MSDHPKPLQPRNLCLDGIRGIAIALVIVHHAFANVAVSSAFMAWIVSLTRSAWVGVDLFFVLSGYLITGILLRSRDRRGYFRIFYMRRFFRIFPLYYSCLALLVAVWFVSPGLRSSLALPWNFFYLANVHFALAAWTWPPISHLWSLSVEEQFYLIWPALIFLMPRRRTLAAILALFCGFVLFRQGVAMGGGANATLIYAVFHLDGLLVGAALAALHLAAPDARRGRSAAWAILAGASAALVFECLRNRGLIWSSWKGLEYLNYSLVAVAGAALIGVSIYSDAGAWVNRIFRWPVLTALGKYSYCIYILHYPIDFVCRKLHLHPAGFAATIPYAILLGGAAFGCAAITWKFLEEPCIRLKDRLFTYEAAVGGRAAAAGERDAAGGEREAAAGGREAAVGGWAAAAGERAAGGERAAAGSIAGGERAVADGTD